MKKSQKETIVSFDESSERVNVFTHNTDLKKRLTKFAEDYPKLCRLIDDNGIMLKKCVMQLIELWGLSDEFKNWVDEACIFTSTYYSNQ